MVGLSNIVGLVEDDHAAALISREDEDVRICVKGAKGRFFSGAEVRLLREFGRELGIRYISRDVANV